MFFIGNVAAGAGAVAATPIEFTPTQSGPIRISYSITSEDLEPIDGEFTITAQTSP